MHAVLALRWVRIQVGDMGDVWGEIHAVHGEVVIEPAEPQFEPQLQRLVQTMWRQQDGVAEQFVADLPARLRLRTYVWAERLELPDDEEPPRPDWPKRPIPSWAREEPLPWRKVVVRLGDIRGEVFGTISTTGRCGFLVRGTSPDNECTLWRMTGAGMRRPQGGDDAAFLLGLPCRLRSYIWAEVVEDRNGQ
jgi:hypothetical protein